MVKKKAPPAQKKAPPAQKQRVPTLEERFPLPSVQEMADDPEKLELLLYAIRERESKHGDFLKKGLTSPNAKGAVGTMQIIPRFYDKSSGRAPGYGLIPLRKDATPEQVETYGRYVYGHMLELYGNPIDASVAYNMGPAKTNAWIKKGRKWNELPSETRKYIPEISSIYAREKALPPEQRMPRGKVLNLPKNDIFPPIPPPPPAPPVVLDQSKAGMAMHREEQLEGRAEPGYLTTLQAEDAVESRAAPGILSAARGSGPALLDLARQLLKRRAGEGAPAPVGEGYEEVPVPRFQDGGEVDLAEGEGIGSLLPEDVLSGGSGKKTVLGGVQSLLSSLRPIRNPREDSPYPKVWSMDPRQKAALASAKVQAESPWLKTLFGVTREDLYETSLRQGNRPGQWDDVSNPRGSETAAQVMTPQNAQRLVDELVEAEKYPEMFRSMHAWYVMDPAYRRLRELMPEEEANRAFARLNSFMAAASPMSEPTTEIPRGLAANVLDNRGLFELFQQYGGKPAQGRAAQFLQDRLGASDEDMRGFVALTEEIPLGKFPGHSAHINQAGMMARMGGNDYRLTGKQPKVVLYSQASGVPDHPHGFQTDSFIPDAGMTRSIGVSDATRANTPGAAMDVATYRDLRPWWREKVAGAAGLEAVPAQAINWASSSPATGIGTSLGASKLELLANYIGRRAIETGEDPFKLRDMILMGRGFADGGEVDLSTSAAGGSGPTEEERQGLGSLADRARNMFSVEGAQNTARYALGQGLGMGWGDEAEAWARSKVTGRSYEDELAEIRAKNKAYEERNPIGSMVADVAGGLIPTAAALALTPVTGGSTAPAALGSLGRMYGLIQKIPSVRRGAAIGATQGAVTGAGVADDDFSREEGAAIGGVLGGTIGAAVPYAAEKLLGVSNRKALLEAASKVPDDTAYDPLRQRLVDEGVISQAVKPKGGNWSDEADIGKELETLVRVPNLRDMGLTPEAATPERLARFWQRGGYTASDVALSDWVQSNLKNYIMRDMATPGDPVRQYFDSLPGLARDQERVLSLPSLKADRRRAGFPEEGYAKTLAGSDYERAADLSALPSTAQREVEYRSSHPDMGSPAWLKSLAQKDPEAAVYAFQPTMNMAGRLRHVVDSLRSATSPNSSLPQNLRIDPESLKKLSVADAFRRTQEIDDWTSAEAARVEREGLKANLFAGPPRLDVPAFDLSFVGQKGGRWVDLPDAGEEAGRKTCTLIGKAGGWCTQEDVNAVHFGSGKNKLHALLDMDGRPHVQIQTVPSKPRESPLINEMKFPENSSGSARAKEYIRRDPQYIDKVTRSVVEFLNSTPNARMTPHGWADFGEFTINGMPVVDLKVSDVSPYGPLTYRGPSIRHLINDPEVDNPALSAGLKKILGVESATQIPKEYLDSMDSRLRGALRSNELPRFMSVDDFLAVVQNMKSVMGGFADGGEVAALPGQDASLEPPIPEEGIGTLLGDEVLSGGAGKKSVIGGLQSFLSRAAKDGEKVGLFSGKAVNAERIPEEVPPNDVLVLMACGGQKIYTSKPTALTGLYCGPMWQTLMNRKGNISNSQIHVLSGEHGLVPGSTQSLPYEKVLTPEKSKEVLETLPQTQQQFARPDGRPWSAVIIAGGGKYRDTFEEIVSRLKGEGLVSPEAAVVATRGGIGDQRKALGEFLRQANERPKTVLEKADGGEVRNGVGSLASVARGMMRRAS